MPTQTFLQLVAQDLVKKYGDDVSEVTLVFPSRRAGLFFNQHLAKLINKPIWSPKVTTINELMQELSMLTVEDPINLVSKLYGLYNKALGTNEPFDNFYFWGEVMLADFDLIDKYLVNPQQLFTNIKDLKDIEEQFGGLTPEQTEALKDYLGVMLQEQVSELREKHLGIWNVLLSIYQDFKKNLEEESLAYEGMAYRKAAEMLASSNQSIGLPKPIAFIGFNALNECEKGLFLACKRNGGAHFYWDYDPIFVDNINHEAGLFIRKNLQLFPNELEVEQLSTGLNSNKKIKLIAAPSTVAQTKIIPRILDMLCEVGAKFDATSAIVFPKENILLPTLQAMPNSVDQLNITMGYPIRETPAYSLAEFLVKLQINSQVSSEGVVRFYHRDVLSVLNHPYIRLCEPEESLSIVSRVKRNNRIYPSDNELANTPFLKEIFSIYDDNKKLSAYIITICNEVAKVIASRTNNEDNEHFRIDLEFLYALHKSLTRLSGVFSEQKFEINHRTFLQLLRKAFVQERVSFSGEPLAGLQLMGFLETRALDFENIIILSFNDDTLPGRNHPVSFITPSLRVGFGLPDYKHHDAVYAYYFYRLLNRAKNIYLIYNARAEGLSSGEKSRYALQLEMEQMVGQVDTIPVGYNLSLTPTLPISIDKTEQVIENLESNLKRKSDITTLSPSGLTTYLTCPLRFYFRYAVGIDEGEEITEEAGALEFGRIIHNTMEELYKPFSGKMVTPENLKELLGNPNHIESVLQNTFCQIFLNDSSASISNLSGRNLLAYNAMLYTIKKMLRFDIQRAPFKLICHEQEVYTSLNINSQSVKLGGFVDRLEENHGTIWAIDYKTGKHDNQKGKFTSIDELFDPAKIDNQKEVLQTFCYSLALRELFPNQPIKPALWFVKVAKSASDMDVSRREGKKSIPVDDFTSFEDDFKSNLKVLLNEIFNPNIPFSQTDDKQRCKNCPFIDICGR